VEDNDRNAIINFRYVGGLLLVTAIVLSFSEQIMWNRSPIFEKSPLSQGAIFFMGLTGFVLMIINNFKGTR
jgi:hypothetical protein